MQTLTEIPKTKQIPLFDHQKTAVDFITKNHGCGALFHDIGTGKTRTILETYSELREIDQTLKLLVVCPLALIQSAWMEDIKKFTDFKSCNLRAGFKPADIYIVNYDFFISEEKVATLRRMISSGNFMCALDESSRIKNHKATTTKRILQLRDLFKYRIVASGTPAPNSETEYWAQMLFVKKGIFNESFFGFRNEYFHLARDGKVMVTQGQIMNRAMAREIFSKGWKYEMVPAKRAQMMSRMLPFSHYAKKKDCLDLPDQIDQVREIEMSPAQRSFYNQMKRDQITEIMKSDIVATVALTKIMKLRQITSGFAIDAEGKNVEIEFSPKLAQLQDLLEDIGQQKVIIWCQFHWEIEKIKAMLGDRAVCLYGETKDKYGAIKAFRDGDAQYLIANPHSAGHGLTFVMCSNQVFFSLDYSWECYEQARGRTHRAGQVNKCTYFHLICKDSIDEAIYSVLKRKADAAEILYKMMTEKR